MLHAHGFPVDLGLEQFFNVAHQALVAARHKADGVAQSAGAACAANAVHIVFGVEGDVKVEHRWHVFDVQAACGHIGTDEQIDFAFFEAFEGFQAFVLALVAVQGAGAKTVAL